jgi:phosphoesterase RecJ-like protein
MKEAVKLINEASKIIVIQAENPDADSLASSLALEEILGDIGKQIYMYCPVNIPKYLRYLEGWDRVEIVIKPDFDLAILVDASTQPLLERVLSPENIKQLSKHAFIVIDHHTTAIDLPLDVVDATDKTAISTGQVIYDMAEMTGWNISVQAAGMLATSIMADSLGLSSDKTTAKSIHILGNLVEKGVNMAELDAKRRLFMKKDLEIFRYKGRLFDRVEITGKGKIAMITIPWEEIQEYSDQYNPSMLIIDEMRLIEGVDLAVAFKTYPDGKITCKLRANDGGQITDKLAEHFGGGGHPFTAGFKVRDMPFDVLKTEFVSVAMQLLDKLKI